jgi:hypothetical protein
MKINTGTGWALAIGAGGLVVYLLWNKVAAAGKAALNVNKGTPYAGAGVVGTLGNVTNQVSGGVLSSLGDWIGGKAYDWTHSAYDPNASTPDRSTLNTGASVISNPVQASPSVLPYSYKQATIDTPLLLGTDQLFTPVVGGGSAGGYTESGTPGTSAGPTTGYYDSGTTTDFGVSDPNSW